MVLPADRNSRARAGFTLLELLLVVVLLLGLLGAVAFNFGSLKTGADLDEGAGQFEALLRLASAQAANSGRPVQVRFDELPTSLSTNEAPVDVEPIALRVVQEMDPVSQPGMFVDLHEARPFIEAIVERVRLASVRSGYEPVLSTNQVSTNVLEEQAIVWPPVTFFADGSCDEAEIVLASIDPEDMRRIAIRLKGLTGEISRNAFVVDADGLAITNEPTTTTTNSADDFEIF